MQWEPPLLPSFLHATLTEFCAPLPSLTYLVSKRPSFRLWDPRRHSFFRVCNRSHPGHPILYRLTVTVCPPGEPIVDALPRRSKIQPTLALALTLTLWQPQQRQRPNFVTTTNCGPPLTNQRPYFPACCIVGFLRTSAARTGHTSLL